MLKDSMAIMSCVFLPKLIDDEMREDVIGVCSSVFVFKVLLIWILYNGLRASVPKSFWAKNRIGTHTKKQKEWN